MCLFVVSGTVRGSFYLGTGDMGQLPASQVLILVHYQPERNAEEGLNHKGIIMKSCLAKYCFSQKSIFQEDMEGHLAILNNQMKSCEGEGIAGWRRVAIPDSSLCKGTK